jgi:hypothetical protein
MARECSKDMMIIQAAQRFKERLFARSGYKSPAKLALLAQESRR